MGEHVAQGKYSNYGNSALKHPYPPTHYPTRGPKRGGDGKGGKGTHLLDSLNQRPRLGLNADAPEWEWLPTTRL